MTYFYPLSALRATSPTRRTRPFCRYRDISPVSAGESTPKEEAKFVIASEAKQTPGRVEVYGVYAPHFTPTDCRGTSCLAMTTIRAIVRWDISLTLNMTFFYICHCEEVKRRSNLPGGWRSTEYMPRTFSGGLPRHFVPRNDNE